MLSTASAAPSPKYSGYRLCDRYPELPSMTFVYVDPPAVTLTIAPSPSAVRRGPGELHLEVAHPRLLGQVADEHHRRRVELVGDDVEVAVAVDVEDDGRARAARAPHGHAPRRPGRVRMALVLARCVQLEPRRRQAALPRLDPEHELRVDESLARGR